MGFFRETRGHWLALLGIQLMFASGSLARAAGNSSSRCLVQSLDALVEQDFSQPLLSESKLSSGIASRRARVPEFRFIREEAQKRGLRVWLFGGTAAGYAHYVKWDLLREMGDTRFQPDRFDYDYTNIYRSTQDLDIVVDGNTQEAQAFQQALKEKFPYFMGSKAAAWEVRSLNDAHGDKGGLLGDFGFTNQHTDSNSTGMIELTDPPEGESVVRDIRDWKSSKPAFLKDVVQGRLTFYHSPNHSQTPRFKSGQNPPIFSVIRALTKAFQYDLKIDGKDLSVLQKEINEFDPKRDLSNPDAQRWIEKNGKKLFENAVDIESAWNTLEKLGLRKKLIAIKNNPQTQDSLAWWMSKEPLRSKPVGEGNGPTAEALGIQTVAHGTRSFLAYESINRSHMGAPNVFISRNHTAGEAAGATGEGLFTKRGTKGLLKGPWKAEITTRFAVDPKAREGTDFVVGFWPGEGEEIVFKNKAALRVIPESWQMSPVEYFKFLAEGERVNPEDKALLWKLKQKLSHLIVSAQVTAEDMNEIRLVVADQMKHPSFNRDVVITQWLTLQGAPLKKTLEET